MRILLGMFVLFAAASLAYGDEPPAGPAGGEARPATPAPAPAPAPAAPAAVPCPAPIQCDPCPCCQPRDACGWPTNWCGCRYGRFEVTLEGTFTLLSNPDGPFGLDSGAANQLRWDALEYAGEIGGRGAATLHTCPGRRIEVRAAYLGSFDDSSAQTGVFGFGSPPAVSPAATTQLSSEAEFLTGEATWWTEVSCHGRTRWDVGAGARAIWFDETAHADAWTAPFPVGAFYEAEAENLFVGAQLCAAMHVDWTCRLETTLSFKGLVGYLRRDNTVTSAQIVGPATTSSESTSDDVAFGFEAEAGLRLRLTPHVALTAGYSLLFLDDVSRAHDIGDFVPSATGAVQARQTGDELVTHTFFVGVNLNF